MAMTPKRGKAQSGFYKNTCSPAFNHTGCFDCILRLCQQSLCQTKFHTAYFSSRTLLATCPPQCLHLGGGAVVGAEVVLVEVVVLRS